MGHKKGRSVTCFDPIDPSSTRSGHLTGLIQRSLSCRLIHAAKGCVSMRRECALMMESRSGLGVTATILHQFREVCIEGRTTRVAHFEQPAFAWK
jgi:hypothetical protein